MLDKGSHHIELKYLPEYIKPACCVSLLFLIIYMTMGFLKISKLKNKPTLLKNADN